MKSVKIFDNFVDMYNYCGNQNALTDNGWHVEGDLCAGDEQLGLKIGQRVWVDRVSGFGHTNGIPNEVLVRCDNGFNYPVKIWKVKKFYVRPVRESDPQ